MATAAKGDPLVAWRALEKTTPTTVVLLRHGVTANTLARLFCGSGGADPGLTDEGRQQAARAARWLARRATAAEGTGRAALAATAGVGAVDVAVTSPLRRCRETADIVADVAGLPYTVVDDLAEAEFGDWDGLSFGEVQQRWPDLLPAWLADSSLAPPGGESVDAVAARTTRALTQLLVEHRGRTVLAVSHVTPIKAVVRHALGTSMQLLHRMQLAPASLTVTQWWPDQLALLRTFSYEPE